MLKDFSMGGGLYQYILECLSSDLITIIVYCFHGDQIWAKQTTKGLLYFLSDIPKHVSLCYKHCYFTQMTSYFIRMDLSINAKCHTTQFFTDDRLKERIIKQLLH